MNAPLDDLFDAAWSLLLRGKNDRKHPYAFPVFATSSTASHPRSRTLVLRNARKDNAELWCYTDRRSHKAAGLGAGGGPASWTFWSPRARLQVNAAGPTNWLDAEATGQIFASLPKHSRKAYATLHPPGTPAGTLTDGLPPDWNDRPLAATDYAGNNFGVLVTRIGTMDILQLHRNGHRRMRAARTDGQWTLSWLVP